MNTIAKLAQILAATGAMVRIAPLRRSHSEVKRGLPQIEGKKSNDA
ncbi:hypothetical protein VB712_10630 [Spirulina sp. CCNP1310]|nr:hypothetical protein [Spirulina sp. CCNP1310]MEA5419678.1 hypothetical protein [Spirulina sp. CCNP1310]